MLVNVVHYRQEEYLLSWARMRGIIHIRGDSFISLGDISGVGNQLK